MIGDCGRSDRIKDADPGVREMPRRILALGLDPTSVDPAEFPGFTAEDVRAFIDSQLEPLRGLGYEVEACLVDLGETAEAVTARHLASQEFDGVMIGAGLRAPRHLLLFERLLNLIHERAPGSRICFNTTPADSVEAVRRWI